MNASVRSLGQIAFEAYCQKTHGRSLVTGDQLPQWWKLKPEIQAAWEAAAKAVKEAPDVLPGRTIST